MPPPPVPNKEPITPITPASEGTAFTEESLIEVSNIVISNAPSPSPSPSQDGRSSIYATPSPEPSHIAEIQRLQSMIQTLEEQNKHLRDSATNNNNVEDTASKALLEQAEQQKAAALQKVSELESSLHTTERSAIEKQGKVEALERQLEEAKKDVTLAKSEGETRLKELQMKVEDSENLVSNLKGLIDAKASAASENDAALAAKQAEIEMLQSQVSRLTTDLQEERKELGVQIEDLRRAGQVRIYEVP
jgi:CAP-Gly domain-containing linker protein 1